MKQQIEAPEPTPLQQIILQQISRHLDVDGACRLTNAELGAICSGVTKKRMSIEISQLVTTGFLTRNLEENPGENPYTKRTLRFTKAVRS